MAKFKKDALLHVFATGPDKTLRQLSASFIAFYKDKMFHAIDEEKKYLSVGGAHDQNSRVWQKIKKSHIISLTFYLRKFSKFCLKNTHEYCSR